jgi:hypothetical protein
MKNELAPCPFCGGDKCVVYPRTCDRTTPYNPADRAFPVVRCRGCGAEAIGDDWGAPETAIVKWNRRALLAAAPAMQEGGERFVYVRTDHLEKLRSGPFLCALQLESQEGYTRLAAPGAASPPIPAREEYAELIAKSPFFHSTVPADQDVQAPPLGDRK